MDGSVRVASPPLHITARPCIHCPMHTSGILKTRYMCKWRPSPRLRPCPARPPSRCVRRRWRRQLPPPHEPRLALLLPQRIHPVHKAPLLLSLAAYRRPRRRLHPAPVLHLLQHLLGEALALQARLLRRRPHLLCMRAGYGPKGWGGGGACVYVVVCVCVWVGGGGGGWGGGSRN